MTQSNKTKIAIGRQKLVDEDYPTRGHEWDGIREYDKPMPRWWLWTFYLTIIWSIGYMIAYPAIPLLNYASPGILGYSTRGDIAKQNAAIQERNAPINAHLLATNLDAIIQNPDLAHYATAGGAAVFRTHCIQCHGSGAQGSRGYPNLLDDDWLWGGDLAAIATTITHGIRFDDDEDARFSEMPAFAEILEVAEITNLAEYVLALSGQQHNNIDMAATAELYADNCAVCHGDHGRGDKEQGAPDLTDAIWLYGGDREAILISIKNSRFGVMPGWKNNLTPAQIKQVAFYVHQLGGGE